MDDNDKPDFRGRFEGRRNLLKAGVGFGATYLAAKAGLDNSAHAADDNNIPEITPRFSVPTGRDVSFSALPNMDRPNFAYWGVNRPIGTPPVLGQLNTEIIIAGKQDINAFGGARLLDAKNLSDADGAKPYLMIGGYKVSGVEVNSIAVLMKLQPGENVQLNNMPRTLIVAEEDGLQKAGAAVYANASKGERKVALIIPPSEHMRPEARRSGMNGGEFTQASDIEKIKYYIAAYKSTRALKKNEFPPGTKDIDIKKAIYKELEPMMWNTFANMALDSGVEATPEQLWKTFKVLIKPGVNKSAGDRLAEKKKKFADKYDNLIDGRETKGKKAVFSYSEEEIGLMFKDGGRPSAHSLLLDFTHFVEYDYRVKLEVERTR